MNPLQFHKISNLFPLMRSDEFEALEMDMAATRAARTDLSLRGYDSRWA